MAQSLIQIQSILDQHEFDFHNLPERLKCVKCHKILKSAKQTTCGCKVCEKCINNYLSDSPKPCPSKQPDCDDVILNLKDDINQDNATNKEISNLKVKCPGTICNYENQLKNMVAHIDNCEFREISCDKCGKKFLVKDKANHDQSLCNMRNAKCEHCQKSMKFRDLEAIHLNSDSDELCAEFIAHCPNKCSVVDKVNLKNHLAVCENKKLECPFLYFNCGIGKMTKETLTNHLKDEFASHMSSLIDKFMKMEEDLKSTKDELESQKQITKELFDMNQTSSVSRIKLEKTIDELRKKESTTIQTVDTRVIFGNGSFIWRFTDFEVRRVDAESGERVSITSDPFYTSEHGYKMCFRIYPAGDGVGKGTHLSVFFAIMKGAFDDLLSWPFKQKVTLSILDQEAGTMHHSLTFRTKYPQSTDDRHITDGSSQFYPLSLLGHNSRYCKNGTLYLKIAVDEKRYSDPTPESGDDRVSEDESRR